MSDYAKSAVRELIDVATDLKLRQEKILRSYDIGLQHFHVLEVLANYFPEAVSAGTIKKELPEKNPDLTRLLDKLVKKKWVERKRWPGNMRKMAISITPQGLYVLREIQPMLEMFYRQIPLDAQEMAQLESLVRKLR